MKILIKVIIGLSVVVVVSVVIVVVVLGKVMEKIYYMIIWIKVKKFVYDKFDGNEKLMEIVDDLLDSDLDFLMGMLVKIKLGKKKIFVYGDFIKDLIEDVKDWFMYFVEKMM